MNRLRLIYLTVSFVLTGCLGSNVLRYKNRIFYEENNVITGDSILQLNQSICYNRPGVIDEEFCYDLELTFVDTLAAKTKRILDLETDTNIVRSKYGIYSVWNWDNENNKVTGQIEIIGWNKDKVTLKEDIVGRDFPRKKIKRFKGTRTFTRKSN